VLCCGGGGRYFFVFSPVGVAAHVRHDVDSLSM
jgi:hypothetical protein